MKTRKIIALMLILVLTLGNFTYALDSARHEDNLNDLPSSKSIRNINPFQTETTSTPVIPVLMSGITKGSNAISLGIDTTKN